MIVIRLIAGQRFAFFFLNRWRFNLLLNTRLGTRWGLAHRRVLWTESTVWICANDLIEKLQMTYSNLNRFLSTDMLVGLQ